MTGAYALIRFSDTLGDQRVNVGLIVWHPKEGFRVQVTGRLSERAKAIDPRAKAADIQSTISAIRDRLSSAGIDGMTAIRDLSAEFTKSIEVTAPYPVRISSFNAIIQRLYQSVISPTPAFYRASNQTSVEAILAKRIADAASRSDWSCERVGRKQINGVAVEVGVRTQRSDKQAILWHALSLKSEPKHQNQVALCKALVTDIVEIRNHLADFKHDDHVVILERPKVENIDWIEESIAWLRHGTDEIVDITDVHSSVVDEEIQRYLSIDRTNESRHKSLA